MSEIADFCILPNPAHRPKFFAGYPGLSPSFPASIICIVYLHLLADMPANAVSLTFKSTLRASSACSPAAHSWLGRGSRDDLSCSHSGRSIKFPIKKVLHCKKYVLWRDGNLVSDEEQEEHEFSVRYVTPTAVFHVRQDLDPLIRDMIRRREFNEPTIDRNSRLPRARTMEELSQKPSLFPVKEYPAPTQTLARGTHLFYFECEVPDLPGDLYTSHLKIAHSLTVKLNTPSRPFPFNIVSREWTEQSTVPMLLPRYSALPDFLYEFPISMRNAPGDPIQFDVRLIDQILLPGTVFRVLVRLVPDPNSLGGSFDSLNELATDSNKSIGVPRNQRSACPPPSVKVVLRQIITVKTRAFGGAEGVRKWVNNIVEVPDVASSTGDLWKRTICVPVPPINASSEGIIAGNDCLHTSCLYRIHLASSQKKKPRRKPMNGTSTPHDLEKPEDPFTTSSSAVRDTSLCSESDSVSAMSTSQSMDLLSSQSVTSTFPSASIGQTLRKAMSAIVLGPVSICSPAFKKKHIETEEAAGQTSHVPGSIVSVLTPFELDNSASLATNDVVDEPSTFDSNSLGSRNTPRGARNTGPRGNRSATAPADPRKFRHLTIPKRFTQLGKLLSDDKSNDEPTSPVPYSVDTREPPTYREIDAPAPSFWVSPECKTAGSDELEISISHELVVTGTVVADFAGNSPSTNTVELVIPVTVNYGKRGIREEIMRYVCA